MKFTWPGKATRAIPPDPRFAGYFRLLDTPLLGDAYIMARRPLRPNLVTARTEIVLDGYPRSANTYSRFAFDHVNPGRRISSHTHTPRTVIRGVRRGLPCIVLIRDSRDAVPSLLQWMPGLSAKAALTYYIGYYSRLMPFRAEVVIAPFERVLGGLSFIIEECNERFGVSFVPYQSTQANEKAVRDRIERLSRRNFGGDLGETSIARPSQMRLRERAAYTAATRAEHDLCVRAVDVYGQFGTGSNSGPPT